MLAQAQRQLRCNSPFLPASFFCWLRSTTISQPLYKTDSASGNCIFCKSELNICWIENPLHFVRWHIFIAECVSAMESIHHYDRTRRQQIASWFRLSAFLFALLHNFKSGWDFFPATLIAPCGVIVIASLSFISRRKIDLALLERLVFLQKACIWSARFLVTVYRSIF